MGMDTEFKSWTNYKHFEPLRWLRRWLVDWPVRHGYYAYKRALKPTKDLRKWSRRLRFEMSVSRFLSFDMKKAKRIARWMRTRHPIFGEINIEDIMGWQVKLSAHDIKRWHDLAVEAGSKQYHRTSTTVYAQERRTAVYWEDTASFRFREWITVGDFRGGIQVLSKNACDKKEWESLKSDPFQISIRPVFRSDSGVAHLSLDNACDMRDLLRDMTYVAEDAFKTINNIEHG